MPWEKNFNEEQALESAMNIFWKKGYTSTSMEDLLSCMKINRGSFYDTFHNKRSLFIMAFQRYDYQIANWFTFIKSKYNPKEAISLVFDTVLKDAKKSDCYNGCFVVNTALELSPHDNEIANLVEDGFARTEAFFQNQIIKGQLEGCIKKSLIPDETAQTFLGLLAGIRVLSRSRKDIKSVQAIVEHAKCILS